MYLEYCRNSGGACWSVWSGGHEWAVISRLSHGVVVQFGPADWRTYSTTRGALVAVSRYLESLECPAAKYSPLH